jgi:hypothetical protein
MDAPRHTKLRGLVSAAFTPRQVARIEDGIRTAARRIVEEAAPTGGGDFVSLIAKRLPLRTISDMIGVPDSDRERVVAAADALVSTGDEHFLAGRDPMAVMGESIWTLSQFAGELAAHRERNPADDLMSALVHAEIDGERLTHAEISAWFVLLSVAGNDTTRHTTSHAMRALTLHPDQRALLQEDLEARLPQAVEEFVRWATPVLHFRRTVTREVELHGERLEPGDKVVLWYLSGNARRGGLRGAAPLRRDPRPELPRRLRRRRAPLLPGRLAGPHPAPVDFRRAPDPGSGHRGGGARSARERLHPRGEADGLQLHAPRGVSAPAIGRASLSPAAAACGCRPAV